MGRRIGVAALVGSLAPAGVARADHDMAMSENHHGEVSELSVGLAVEAAEFDTRSYVGSYQAVTPSVGWMRGRFGAGAALSLYHLDENGRSLYGPGDAMLTGHVAVLRDDAIQAGAAVHVMLPSGSELDNLGMGHTMAMAGAWATWRARPLTVTASAGYARALVGDTGAHDHGAMPLVDPMNLQEATWSASAAVDVGRGVQVGGRALGGVAIGTGTSRVIGSGRVAWGTPRVSTGLEVQLGLAGDPFTIRGVLDTALRF
ncbi:MAG TPA: hypothetical protein VK607_26260 [Kofleriaceae bacterium]|nr:hypothetical protein [Kofleriaceae bacterium]